MIDLILIITFICIFLFEKFRMAQTIVFFSLVISYVLNEINTLLVTDITIQLVSLLSISVTSLLLIININLDKNHD